MNKKFVVIGLGNFGTYLAILLIRKGAEILAIDNDMEKLDQVKEITTHAVRLDSTDAKALKTQNLYEYDGVIVTMGDDFESSILTVANLQQSGIKRIIVRATTEMNKKILIALGINEVILPAEEAAERVANTLMLENVVDSFLLESNYSIVEVRTLQKFVGKTLQELNLLKEYNVSVVTIKRKKKKTVFLGIGEHYEESIIGIPHGATMIESGDILVLFGTEKDIQKIMKE